MQVERARPCCEKPDKRGYRRVPCPREVLRRRLTGVAKDRGRSGAAARRSAPTTTAPRRGGAPRHPSPRRLARSPARWATASRRAAGVVGVEEQAGAAVVDEVERTAAGRGDDREPGRGRLLEGLAERLPGRRCARTRPARHTPARGRHPRGARGGRRRARRRRAGRRRRHGWVRRRRGPPAAPGARRGRRTGAAPSRAPAGRRSRRAARPCGARIAAGRRCRRRGATPGGTRRRRRPGPTPRSAVCRAPPARRAPPSRGGEGQVGELVDPPHPAPRAVRRAAPERPRGVLARGSWACRSGRPRPRAIAQPGRRRPSALAPRTNGDATCTTSGANRPAGPRPHRSAARPGTAGRARTRRRARDTRPSSTARAGAMTTTSCPRSRRHSSTRQTLVVTPLRLGRNDSVTMAMRTITSVRTKGEGTATSRGVSGERRVISGAVPWRGLAFAPCRTSTSGPSSRPVGRGRGCGRCRGRVAEVPARPHRHRALAAAGHWDRLTPLTGAQVLVVTGVAHAEAVAAAARGCLPTSCSPSPRPATRWPPSAGPRRCSRRRDPEAVLGSFAADHVIGDEAQFRECVSGGRGRRRGWARRDHRHRTHPCRNGFRLHRAGRGARRRPGARGAQFVEKPDRERAEGYLATGGFRWNAGMFVVRASVLLDLLAAVAPRAAPRLRTLAADPSRLDEVWPGLEKIAIDHAVAEPAAAEGGSPSCPAGSAGTTWATSLARRAAHRRRPACRGLRVLGDADRVRVLDRRGRGPRWPTGSSPWSASTTSWSSTPPTRCSSCRASGPRTSRASSTRSRRRAAPTSPDRTSRGSSVQVAPPEQGAADDDQDRPRRPPARRRASGRSPPGSMGTWRNGERPCTAVGRCEQLAELADDQAGGERPPRRRRPASRRCRRAARRRPMTTQTGGTCTSAAGSTRANESPRPPRVAPSAAPRRPRAGPGSRRCRAGPGRRGSSASDQRDVAVDRVARRGSRSPRRAAAALPRSPKPATTAAMMPNSAAMNASVRDPVPPRLRIMSRACGESSSVAALEAKPPRTAPMRTSRQRPADDGGALQPPGQRERRAHRRVGRTGTVREEAGPEVATTAQDGRRVPWRPTRTPARAVPPTNAPRRTGATCWAHPSGESQTRTRAGPSPAASPTARSRYAAATAPPASAATVVRSR